MSALPPLLPAALAVLGALVSCTDRKPVEPSPGPWNRPLAARRADPYPRQFTNAKGEVYQIPAKPQRIASGTLFSDVIVLACCPAERIAALHEVSKNERFSTIAEASQRFPRHLTPDPESFLAVRPDLVFLSSFSDQRLQQLVSAPGRTVVRLHAFQSLQGIAQSIRAVGYVIGEDAAAEGLVVEMEARLAAVRKQRDGRRRWRIMSWVDGFSAGRETVFDDVLGFVGATNVAAEAGLVGAQRVTVERILSLQPEALVLGVTPGKEEDARQQLLRLNGLDTLPAIREGRLVYVPNAVFLATSHHLAGMAEVIASTLTSWEKR